MQIQRSILDRIPFPFYDLFVLSQVILLHAIMAWKGLHLDLRSIYGSFALFTPVLFGSLVIGVPLRYLFERSRGGATEYIRKVGSAGWILSSMRLLLFWVLTLHVYFWIKLLVPILHPGIFDAQLWEIDRDLLFGLSPNIFFLNLFSSRVLVRMIDWLYAYAFFSAVLVSFPYFMTLPDDRPRFSYAVGGAFLWIGGAWLYLAVPSMGPAYRFPDVWADLFPLFNESRYWQYRLLRNYLLVLEIPKGSVSGKIDLSLGIAAFPSMHVAFQTYLAMWFRRYLPKLRLAFYLVVAFTVIGSIVTGWHYMIDAIAGLILGLACYFAAATSIRNARDSRPTGSGAPDSG